VTIGEKPVSSIKSYHAHIYYDAETKDMAQEVRAKLEVNYPDLTYGRWHDKPVGPHPDWSSQVAFPASRFADVVPWFALNRAGLVIFIHPESGDELADHRDHAIWLGAMRELDLSIF
jgi:aromatic ring-cleaving dioxygenase